MAQLAKLFQPNGWQRLIRDVGPETWFGPGQPVQTQAPVNTPIRAFPYEPGVNLQYTPRGNAGISFEFLRQVSRGYDLMRLVIETAKDRLIGLPWQIRVKQQAGLSNNQRAKQDLENKQVQAATALFQKPDGFRPYAAWLRVLLEDLLVLDAPTVYVDRAAKQLVVIDGATVNRVVDVRGLTPAPPDIAYQQIVYGTVAGSYTRDQLVYMPRNASSDRLYGYSPVEQILTTINIATRRQEHQLNEYTVGNLPEAMVFCPPDWTIDQVKSFQDYFDTSVNLATRRTVRFLPSFGDSKANALFPKASVLKDEMDDYLVKIFCYAFNVSPQQIIKQMNRASAEQSSEVSDEEGIKPSKVYLRDLHNRLLELLGFDQVEWTYPSERVVDPHVQAQIDDTDLKNGSKCIDEIRIARGDEPFNLPETKEPGLYSATGWVPLNAASAKVRSETLTPDQLKNPEQKPGEPEPPIPPGKGPKEEPQPGKKKPFGKAAQPKYIQTHSDETPRTQMARARMESTIRTFFAAETQRILASLGENPDKQAALDAVDSIDWTPIVPALTSELYESGVEGVNAGALQVESTNTVLIGKAQDGARAYAQKRAAEMVGMKRTDAGLVPNPNAKWAISDTTREQLRETIEKAFTDETPMADLQKSIQEAGTFSDARAEMIARTETVRAQTGGQVKAWKETGLVKSVKLQLSSLHQADGCCEACDVEAAKGAVSLDEIEEPPLHPNCRCALVVEKLEGEADDAE